MVVHTSNTVATEFKLKDFTQGLIIDSIKASSTIEILKGGKTIGETTVVPKMPVLTYFSLCNAMVGGKLPFLIYSEDGDLLQGLHLLVSYGGVLELDNDDVYYIVKMTGLASAQTVTYRNWDSLSGGSPFKITKFALDEDKTDERVDVSNVDLVAYPFSLQTKMYVSILSEYKNAQGQNARRDVSYDFKTLISQDDMLKKKTLIRLYVKVHRFLKVVH